MKKTKTRSITVPEGTDETPTHGGTAVGHVSLVSEVKPDRISDAISEVKEDVKHVEEKIKKSLKKL